MPTRIPSRRLATNGLTPSILSPRLPRFALRRDQRPRLPIMLPDPVDPARKSEKRRTGGVTALALKTVLGQDRRRRRVARPSAPTAAPSNPKVEAPSGTAEDAASKASV
jgi:hypothetical protein